MAVKKETIKKVAVIKEESIHKTQELAMLGWVIPAEASAVVYFKDLSKFIGPIYLRMYPGIGGGNSVERVVGREPDNKPLNIEVFDSSFRGLPAAAKPFISLDVHSPFDASVPIKLSFMFRDPDHPISSYDISLLSGLNRFLIPVKLIK